ncbi:MAG: putative peptidoglycan glycosyltransferase FtsW [Candidatus Paracaedibacteraceae bacterium]|nr:putative peptidoglycan glycosyltransferase FtsW [Candidatus Paracaedibacteraceae bacterium]
MNTIFSRRDTSVIGRWWWTVDRWSLSAILIILGLGVLLSFAASPSVANRLNVGTFFFVKRHLIMVPPALFIMFGVSLLNPLHIRRLASLVYLVGVLMLVITLFYGVEVKGAKRWLMLLGTSLQASEFIKPAFAVLAAWMLAEKYKDPQFPGILVSLGLLGILVTLLLLQPDLGMTLVLISTWVGQLFVAGMPLIWMGILAGIGIVGLCSAYFLFPHVARRMDQFFDPAAGDPKQDLYQVTQSLKAFMQGGMFGRGPGEGVIKKNVPDAHADFVFAVAGEEFGLFLCLFIVALFAFIVLRSLIRSMQDTSIFVMMAASGLVIQFGLQAFVNMASSLHLIPTKGMTMPFISYGGSSLVALAISMGMLLALTRKRHGVVDVL